MQKKYFIVLFTSLFGILLFLAHPSMAKAESDEPGAGISAGEILNNQIDESTYTPTEQTEEEKEENQAKPTESQRFMLRSALPEPYAQTALSSANQYIINQNYSTATIEKQLKNFTRFAYSDGVGKPRGIVIHETANDNSTIDSEINYMTNNWQNAFVHAFVDRKQIIEIHPTDYGSWGAGPKANPYFVQVELVREKNKEDFYRSVNNDAYYAAYILKKYNLTPINAHNTGSGTVWSHDAVSRFLGGTTHSDPVGYFARYGYTFNEFFQLVQYKYDRMDKTYYTSVPINPRTDAKWDAPVAMKIDAGALVKVDTTKTKNGWAYIKYDNKTGYIPFGYIQTENTISTQYTKDKINLRTDGKWDSPVAGTVPAGEAVIVNGSKYKNGWAYLTYTKSNISGYIPTTYFQKTNPMSDVYTTMQMNLRAEPVWDSAVTTRVPFGAKVQANSAKTASNGWKYVTYNGIGGYQPASYFSTTNPAKTVYTNSFINPRTDAKWDSKIAYSIPAGEKVQVDLTKTKNGWWYVTYNGKSGYHPTAYFSDVNKYTTYYAIGFNLRAEPNWNSAVVTSVPTNAKVAVDPSKTAANGWIFVAYDRYTGYIPSTYVKK